MTSGGEPNVTGAKPPEREPCVHDSTRRDGTLDNCCLRCGAAGYWHFGHRHDRLHPSGKILLSLDCPDSSRDIATDDTQQGGKD
jgi:hypothetical protein